MESSIKINILGDEEVVDDLPQVPVDKNLQACLISKTLVHRLGARYEAVPKSSVTDSTGRTHAVIGEIFSVVNTLSTEVILGASALPKDKESDSLKATLSLLWDLLADKYGLLDQKKEQEKKSQDAQARRDKETKEQQEKDKQKQASQKTSQTSQREGK